MDSSEELVGLDAFIDAVAAETPAPGSGAVAAVTVVLGAALVEMAARFSGGWDGSEQTLERAEALRARGTSLAQADEEAYADFLGAFERDGEAEARSRTIAVPLEVAECAAEVAALAASLAEHGNQNLLGEAIGAAHTASAAAAIAAKLVEINLAGEQDARLDRVREHAAAAAEAAACAAGFS